MVAVEPPKGMRAIGGSGCCWLSLPSPAFAAGAERAEFKLQPGAEPRSTR
jgi:hypothetical protein